MSFLKQHYWGLAIASATLGVVLVLLAELAHTEWTKIFGAVFVSLGATGIGIRYGLAGARPGRRYAWLARARADLGALVAILLVGPMLAALVLSLIGSRALEALSRPVGALGLGLNFALALLTVGALRIALGAWTRAAQPPAESPASESH